MSCTIVYLGISQRPIQVLPSFRTPFDDDDIAEFKQFSAGSFVATPGIYRKSLNDGSLRSVTHR